MCWLRSLFLSAQWPLFTLCEAGYPDSLGNLPPPNQQAWSGNFGHLTLSADGPQGT